MAWEWLAPTVTGCVGIAGIAGTVWGSSAGRKTQLDVVRVGIEAEHHRRQFADKRDLYAKVLHHFEEIAESEYDLWLSNKAEAKARATLEALAGSNPDRPSALKAHGTALRAQNEALKAALDRQQRLRRLRAEVAVVTGLEMARLVDGATEGTGHIRETGSYQRHKKSVDDLAQAMRADLLGS